ncbi:MAG TPA: NAD-dependent epimerase/dehydratase family protein [Acidimicrobiales bacterium]|nr:NAD-dependent epimerase/dehydratase family protein [Acidimicrobiales bacterium]
MPRVLVTGASGLLGRRTVPLLKEKGWDVVTTGRRDPDHPADVTRPGSLAALVESLDPDAVVHLAGGAVTGDVSTWELNLLPGVELLHAAARSARRPRVVLIGSAAEYGVDGDGVTEETPAHPVSDYGRAKSVQTVCARRFHQNGIPVLVVRPFNVVAPDLPPSSALGNLRSQVMACRPAPSCEVRCGRLDVVRDFVTADFVARVLVRCLEAWPGVPVLNVASGHGIALGEVFDAFGAVVGMRLRYRPAPELTAIAGPDVLTADPAALEAATALRCEVDAHQLARELAGPDGSPSSQGETP